MRNREPLSLAIIGSGNRTNKVYYPLFKSLEKKIKIEAICDPNKESCDKLAARLNVKAFYSVKDLINAEIIEIALVICPIDLHYAFSIFLSENKIHHLIETSMCSTLDQANKMVDVAYKNKVIMMISKRIIPTNVKLRDF